MPIVYYELQTRFWPVELPESKLVVIIKLKSETH